MAGVLRRALLPPDRSSEAGDTLIEVLVTLIILSICAVALIITFATAITASADHRNLTVNDTVLRNMNQAAFYQLEQQPTPKFVSCATSATYTTGANPVIFNPPTGYAVAIGTVQYWNGTSFQSSCPTANAAQLITLNVTNPNGSNATTQTVVDGFGVLQTPVTVTAVSPSYASQGTSNLLLTITGTGFLSGATVSFPTGITVVGNATFVSPTTLNVFVNISATANPSPSPSQPTYTITVTNPSQTPVTSAPLFAVIQTLTTGMHVSQMVANIGDPAADDPDENSVAGWDAWDTITVVSQTGAPLAGVVVNGSWSQSPSGSDPGTSSQSCTTDATGSCTVYYGYADKLKTSAGVNTATFTVSSSTSTNPGPGGGGLVLIGQTYQPALNTPSSLTISAS